MRSAPSSALALLALSFLAACGDDGGGVYRTGEIVVSSAAFEPGGRIPKRHAPPPDGQDLSPPLAWSGAPAATKAYALVVDDPDAGPPTFVHWVAWNLPASRTSLAEGASAAAGDFVQGKNDFGKVGWGGPQPPPGKSHRYAFAVYALDAPLSLAPGSTAAQLVEAMKGHVLSTGRLVALFP
jgi:Raf kinase inhibitor-like YbhB/YbcL family protein